MRSVAVGHINIPVLEPNLNVALRDSKLPSQPFPDLVVWPGVDVEPVLENTELLRRRPSPMLDFKVTVQHGSSSFIKVFLPFTSHWSSESVIGNVCYHLREPGLRPHRRIVGRIGLSGDRVLGSRHEALRHLSRHRHRRLLLEVHLGNALDRLAHGRLAAVTIHLHGHLHLRWLLLLLLRRDTRLAHGRICDLLSAVWGEPDLLHEGKRLNGQYCDKLSLQSDRLRKRSGAGAHTGGSANDDPDEE